MTSAPEGAVELLPLTRELREAVLTFEQGNRQHFAQTVSDRGDAYFTAFDRRFEALLAEQADGRSLFTVLLDEDGAVLGRSNLMDLDTEDPEVGFRVAERAAGAGVATAGVLALCEIAWTEHRLDLLRAAVSAANLASARVLRKAGFEAVGQADPGHLGGKPGQWFERRLSTSDPDLTRPVG